ncbi:MAG: hypothetical protein GY756_06905, partial [bacterium]|nr:hypothetical protein [bacterium]
RKGLLKYSLDNKISLTEAGEEYLYGFFDLTDGIDEFIKIIKHYKCIAGSMLPLKNILSIKDEYLSPLNNKNYKIIIESILHYGYIKKTEEGYVLTDSGEKFFYN